MTNDHKQRPMFASFDGVFNTLLFAILGIIIPRIADGYTPMWAATLPPSSCTPCG